MAQPSDSAEAFAAWTVPTALAAARTGQVEAWIHRYLAVAPWANPELSAGLRLQPRWWRGPLEVPVDVPQRCIGPEPGLNDGIDIQRWNDHVHRLCASLRDPLAVAPLIVQYDHGTYMVRDGNHRLEAFRRLGWPRCWIVIWYDTAADARVDRRAGPGSPV